MPARTIDLLPLRGELSAPLRGNWVVKLDDPARSVMTDFTEHHLISVAAATQVDEALEQMKHAQVRSAFVTDPKKDTVVGLITAYDIMGEKPIRHIQENGGAREDVTVADIMDTARDWQVARLADVEKATVATMLETFKATGRTHIAVVEEKDGKGPRLRGVFSGAKLLRLTEKARQAGKGAKK